MRVRTNNATPEALRLSTAWFARRDCIEQGWLLLLTTANIFSTQAIEPSWVMRREQIRSGPTH